MRTLIILTILAILILPQIGYVHPQIEEIYVSDGNIIELRNLSSIYTNNIVVERNSTLILRNMELQLSVRGEKNYNLSVDNDSSLILENSNIISLGNESIIRVSNSSKIIGTKGSSLLGFNIFSLQNSLNISFTESNLEIDLINGTTENLMLTNSNCSKTAINVTSRRILLDSSNIEILNLETEELEGMFVTAKTLNFNCTSATLTGISSDEMNVSAIERISLSRSNIGDSNLYSSGNVTVLDSTFGNLKVGTGGKLYNVTTLESPLIRAGGMIYVYENSTLERYWYMKVNVTDITGFPIPAKIEIYDHLDNLENTVVANSKGLYSQPTLAEITTYNATTFVGNYRLKAYYNLTEQVGRQVMTLDTISTEENIHLDSNMEAHLKFFDVILGLSPITLSVNPNTVLVGDTITINGTIKMPISGEAIEIIYEKPDNTTLSKIANTDERGKFITEIKPDKEGRWMIHADWIGGTSYLENSATVSRKTSFFVEGRLGPFAIIFRIMPIFIIVIAVIIGVAFIFIRAKRIDIKLPSS
ncbi:hypothetical protein AC481_02545 [miscellaneous Crenarchaeota group archaeon SMTZ-80]|nr:MAG: hypothetical protein AC481_02545 [miscellaneous Crenarchaeota group archaeon SMTZ-80]